MLSVAMDTLIYANINVRTLELVPSLKQDVLDGDHGAVCFKIQHFLEIK